MLVFYFSRRIIASKALHPHFDDIHDSIEELDDNFEGDFLVDDFDLSLTRAKIEELRTPSSIDKKY